MPALTLPAPSCRNCQHRQVCKLRWKFQEILAGARDFLGPQVTAEEDAIHEALAVACLAYLPKPEEGT